MFHKHAATLEKIISKKLFANVWKKFYDEKIKSHNP